MSMISLSSPTMSDKTLLLSVEDLIGIAMGPTERNTVNFKVIQSVLYILARQLRLLEQKVVLVAGELPDKRSQSRGRRGRRGDEEPEYQRPHPPKFKNEAERIAWEEEQDELERQFRAKQRGQRGHEEPEYQRPHPPKFKNEAERIAWEEEQDELERQFRAKQRGQRGHEEPEYQRPHPPKFKNEAERIAWEEEQDELERQFRAKQRGHRGHEEPEYQRPHPPKFKNEAERIAWEEEQDELERQFRAKQRGHRGHEEPEYHRPHPPKFKNEAERIAWEKEQDELERQFRAKHRGKKGHEEAEYQRPPPPKFKNEAERIAWEEEQDELERQSRRRKTKPAGDLSEDLDEDEHGYGPGSRRESRGRDSRRGSAVGRDEDGAGGQGRSRGRRRSVGGRTADRYGQEGGRDKSAGGRGLDDQEESGSDRPGGGRDGRGRRERGRPGEDKGASEEKGGEGRGRGGKQGIGVREIDGPGKEKLLIVEKGPTTIGTARGRGSIAVVTQSQFQLLEAQVEELMRVAGPLPQLTMPDNQQLRHDLAAGASLTDAMQAMQVSARVQAAEQAIAKLGGILTQLAASGALPSDAAGAVMSGGWMDADEALLKSTSSGTAYKSMRIDPSAKDVSGSGPGGTSRGAGTTGVVSKDVFPPGVKFVSKPEMGSALMKLREEVTKALQSQIDKASTAAEAAEKTAKTVGEKVEELLRMDSRLNALNAMVGDYTEQLNGFDAGLTTQMASFKEQMSTMRAELQGGLEQLETGNSNPETAACMELNERFEGLVRGLDDTLLQHATLSNMQHQLTQELKTLVEGVEMLREQKADRDELLDILRDKADISMLDGLVRQEEFDLAQEDLEQRLDQCNKKFQKQDEVWMGAVKDLRELADTKAQLTELLKIRDEATAQLRNIDDRINRLALILGEPKAAMLMRKLARDAVCGLCLAPAMMHPGGDPLPPALPAMRGPGLPLPCAPEPKAPDYPDFRTHKCHRWVGGSHTLLPATRAYAAPVELADVTKKFTDYGEDGRLYWMETPMEACVECNPDAAPAPPGTARSDGAGAGGDAAGGGAAPASCDC